MLFLLLILGHFWCSVITTVTFGSNLSYFEKVSKKDSTKIQEKIVKQIKIRFFFFFK